MKPTTPFLLTLLGICCSLALWAQTRVGVINDPDGYTMLRAGQSKDASILDTLFADDFYQFPRGYPDGWVKVEPFAGKGISGFIHHTRIMDFRYLDPQLQQGRIIRVLDKHRVLADAFHDLAKENSPASAQARQQLESHSEAQYDPILLVLPYYFCNSHDTTVLRHLFACIWADKGSANELPSTAIGECYTCDPDKMIGELDKLADRAQKKAIFDQIEWGLRNMDELEATSTGGVMLLHQYWSKLEKARQAARL